MKQLRPYPPDYVSKETLAYRLDLSIGAVEQYVKRGLLPEPVMIGEAQRWRWSDVDARYGVATGVTGDATNLTLDPYLIGADHAAQAAAARRARPKPDGP